MVRVSVTVYKFKLQKCLSLLRKRLNLYRITKTKSRSGQVKTKTIDNLIWLEPYRIRGKKSTYTISIPELPLLIQTTSLPQYKVKNF